jgi:phage tail sheath protein FI
LSSDFLHGVEVITIDDGPRPVQTIRSAVIGLIGTAPLADATAFPLDTPVLVNSRGGYALLGLTGTLPDALAGIFDQFGAFVVVVRVDAGMSQAAAVNNVIGSQANMTGVFAFRKSETLLGLAPMILIAPGFTSDRPVGATAAAVTTAGVGYTSAPTVTFAGGGSDANKVLPTGHAVLGTAGAAGTVTGVVIDNPGRNISGSVTYTFTGGGFGTAATPGAVTTAAGVNPVASALLTLATMQRAHVIVDGPNTTDSEALAYRNDWSNRRIFIVDPAVKVYNADPAVAAYEVKPASARVAGLIARIDSQVGFWKSPSNETINGIGGLGREVDWALGDPNTRANLLNENDITTFIRDEGWRLWGNRTASSDAKWSFLAVSRTADMIDVSIQKAHRWAVDRVINRAYFDEVAASVNAYLRQLKAQGAILGGKCWVDPDFNAPADIAAGHATFSYDFTPPTPAERVTFRSTITDNYISSIFAQA